MQRPVQTAKEKTLRIVSGEIRTPPFSAAARVEAGFLLRQLQQGELLSMPHSRPMPSIGANVHEIRIRDEQSSWRIMYYLDAETVLVLEVFSKKTEQTPQDVIDTCKKRVAAYIAAKSSIEKGETRK